MLRFLAVLFTLASAAGAAILTWPAFFGLSQWYPIAQIIAFRGALALAFLALTIFFLLLCFIRAIRGFAFSLTIIFALAALVNGIIVFQQSSSDQALPDRGDSSIRVMTWNTAGAATDAATIARIAVAMDADVVTLPETTISTGEEVAVLMRELGSPMWAHHTNNEQTPWDASSTTLLISPELGDYAVVTSSVNGTENTGIVPSVVAMPVNGQGPTIVASHAVAPRPENMEQWRADLSWLADQCAGGSVILAGDFNATVEHLRPLGLDGADLGRCYDAAYANNNASFGTWPSSLPPALGTAIDHVLTTSNWTATSAVVLSSMDDSGSDHRPLVVQLEPNSAKLP